MNIFEPVISQSSPSRTARVASEPASEPVPGSVRPKQASASPAQSRGSHSLLLRRGAVRGDGLADQAERDRDQAAHGRVAAPQLLEHEAVGDVVAAAAAHLLRDRQPEQAEVAESPDDVAVDRLAPVPLGGEAARSRDRRSRPRASRTASCSGDSDRSMAIKLALQVLLRPALLPCEDRHARETVADAQTAPGAPEPRPHRRGRRRASSTPRAWTRCPPGGSPPSWACAARRSTTTSPRRTRSSTRSRTPIVSKVDISFFAGARLAGRAPAVGPLLPGGAARAPAHRAVPGAGSRSPAGVAAHRRRGLRRAGARPGGRPPGPPTSAR